MNTLSVSSKEEIAGLKRDRRKSRLAPTTGLLRSPGPVGPGEEWSWRESNPHPGRTRVRAYRPVETVSAPARTMVNRYGQLAARIKVHGL